VNCFDCIVLSSLKVPLMIQQNNSNIYVLLIYLLKLLFIPSHHPFHSFSINSNIQSPGKIYINNTLLFTFSLTSICPFSIQLISTRDILKLNELQDILGNAIFFEFYDLSVFFTKHINLLICLFGLFFFSIFQAIILIVIISF